MSKTAIVLLMAFVLVGLAGIGRFFYQAFRHLRSRTPISVMKNAVIRAVWLLLLFTLMFAILVVESIGSESLVCAGLVFVSIGASVLLSGSFIERQYNHLVKDHRDENSG